MVRQQTLPLLTVTTAHTDREATRFDRVDVIYRSSLYHIYLHIYLLGRRYTESSVCQMNVVYLQRCLVVTWLMPHETASVSAHVLCTLYGHVSVYSVTPCAATYVVVTCHLYFWQNDRDLLPATALTLVYVHNYRYRNKNWEFSLEKSELRFLPVGF